MEDTLSYRKAENRDLEQLRDLGLRAYGQFKNVLGEAGWQKMQAGLSNPETYRRLLETGTCFVCEHNGQLCGMAFVVLSGNPFSFFSADWSYIRLVGVDPAWEGKGIGRALTRMCLDHARSSGEKTIALHTSEFQNAARHIYESMGFVVDKKLEPIFEKTYWLYTLSLEK